MESPSDPLKMVGRYMVYPKKGVMDPFFKGHGDSSNPEVLLLGEMNHWV